jgi:hypothetical protein
VRSSPSQSRLGGMRKLVDLPGKRSIEVGVLLMLRAVEAGAGRTEATTSTAPDVGPVVDDGDPTRERG